VLDCDKHRCRSILSKLSHRVLDNPVWRTRTRYWLKDVNCNSRASAYTVELDATGFPSTLAIISKSASDDDTWVARSASDDRPRTWQLAQTRRHTRRRTDTDRQTHTDTYKLSTREIHWFRGSAHKTSFSCARRRRRFFFSRSALRPNSDTQRNMYTSQRTAAQYFNLTASIYTSLMLLYRRYHFLTTVACIRLPVAILCVRISHSATVNLLLYCVANFYYK